MTHPDRFDPSARLLHWGMAALIFAMLLIGVSMVTSLADYHALVAVHRPLGILILLFAVARLVNRWRRPPPPLPPDLPAWQRNAALASHVTLYCLMLAMPLIGWAMLSAARYPVAMIGPFVLPPIVPRSPMAYAWLHRTHEVLAYALFTIVLAHLGAALMHALIRRDGVFGSMAPWPSRRGSATHSEPG